METQVKNMLKELEPALIKFTQDIIRIKSITCEEKEVALFIKEKMIELGYDDVIIDKLGNVIGVIGNGETKVMYDSHIDTVTVNDEDEWKYGAFSGEIVDGNIYGRGTVDMKSAVAATVYAGYAIKKLGLDKGKTIYISTSVMEEDYDGQALLYLCKENDIYPDYVIICEPSSMNLALGHRGRALIKINTTGVSAHGSAPEKGDNAVYKMNEIIKRVEKLGQEFISREGEKGSVALTKIESGAVSLNAIPPTCSIYLDRRLIIGEDKQFIAKEIEKLIEGTGATWEIYDEVGKSWTDENLVLHSFLPAWEIHKDHELTKACLNAYGELNGEAPKMFKWDFCTNGVATAGILNIPTIGIGPGDPKLAHTRDEHCPLSDIIEACEFYTNLAKHL